jgi:hypothetical protein
MGGRFLPGIGSNAMLLLGFMPSAFIAVAG